MLMMMECQKFEALTNASWTERVGDELAIFNCHCRNGRRSRLDATPTRMSPAASLHSGSAIPAIRGLKRRRQRQTLLVWRAT
jgi:hypothetical protein